jgi:hypothetical protein
LPCFGLAWLMLAVDAPRRIAVAAGLGPLPGLSCKNQILLGLGLYQEITGGTPI